MKTFMDEIGRLNLPEAYINLYRPNELEFYTHKDEIILKPITDKCIFCNAENNLIKFKNKHVCRACIKSIE